MVVMFSGVKEDPVSYVNLLDMDVNVSVGMPETVDLSAVYKQMHKVRQTIPNICYLQYSYSIL
jgi:hypothetical protein